MTDQIAYTVKDAAAAVGVSTKTIYDAVAAEHLPAKNISRTKKQAIRIGHADLVAWFQSLDDYEPPNGGR